MFRPAIRSVSSPSVSRALPRPSTARRFISTAPPHKTSRSWKNSALRWGLAGGLVYYYNSSNAFAAEPAHVVHSTPETPRETETYPTIESTEKSRAQAKAESKAREQAAGSESASEANGAQSGSPEDLEQEASQQGAFNEETGEINWDCPCLGGMAHGPCGEQFREAFSCFVFSKEEPKGVDCIEHFKTMQNCFREHPEIYGTELDEEQVSEEIDAQNAPASGASSATEAPEQSSQPSEQRNERPVEDALSKTSDKIAEAEKQVEQHKQPKEDSLNLVPKAAHDAR